MNNIKRIFSGVMAAALVTLTAACGGGEALQISSADDLKDQKISVQAGTVGESLAAELVGEANADNVQSFTLYSDAITALTSGKVAATLLDAGPAQQFVDANDQLMILPDEYENEQYAIAVKKGNTELLDKINPIIERIKSDGTLEAIQEKYATTEVKAADIDLNTGAAGGQLILGTEAGFPPYEMKEGSGFIGIDIEIGALIAKELDMELVVEDMAFDSLPLALQTDKIDIIAAGMTVTEERLETTDFTVPYIEDARQVIVIRTKDYAGSGS